MSEQHDELRALELLSDLNEVRAPQTLRRRIDELQREPRRRRRRLPFLAGAGASALGAGVIALLTTGGQSATPSIAAAAQLGLSRATSAPPAQDPRHPRALLAAVQGVSYPYWEDSVGWRDTGQRTDRLGGRPAVTVFYSNAAGQRLGYTIVAAPALALPAASTVMRHGTTYSLLTAHGAQVVTWRRAGLTCVLSALHVSSGRLLALASSVHA